VDAPRDPASAHSPGLAPGERRARRKHKTLKAGACRPPRVTLAAQQRPVNRFRSLSNDERPHEFLGGRPPGSRYTASPRPLPDRLPPLEYPGHFLVKRVTNAGTFRLNTSCSSSPTRSNSITSGSKKPTTASPS
jgi:hypothetical protein